MKDDLIRRETIIRALDKSISGMREVAAGDRIMTKAIKLVQIARDFADNLPAVEAVEVVRCKDCKHGAIVGVGFLWCKAWERLQTMGEEGYCNFGERREDDG